MALEKSPEYRVWIYIRDFVGRPLPECEEAIASHPFSSLCYAVEMLHDRFPMGEKAIAGDASGSYPKQYAEEVLGLPSEYARYWQPAWSYIHGQPWGGKIWGEKMTPQSEVAKAGKKHYEKLMAQFSDNAKLLASLTPEEPA
jgi:hypothetical protein